MGVFAKGVAGTGKTTLGRALAQSLGLPYVEGDDLHPRSNVEKMSSGQPLTDSDREPWLRILRRVAEEEINSQFRIDPQEKQEDWEGIHAQDYGKGNDLQQTRKSPASVAEMKKAGVVITCSALKKYYRDIIRGKGISQERTQAWDVQGTGGSVSGRPTDSARTPQSPAARSSSVTISTYFVFIHGNKETLRERMERRQGHFMKVSMLESQLRDLESPVETNEDGVIPVDLSLSTAEQVNSARNGLSQFLHWLK